MASRYLLLQDYATVPSATVQPGYVSATSSCVVAIWSFTNPTTYSRKVEASGSTSVTDALKVNPVLILDTTITNCQTSSSKQSYTSSCNISLLPSAVNFISQVHPGDWMMVWIVNNEEQRITLRQKLATSQRSNDFHSGLKFIGRVSSVRQQLSQSAMGMRELAWNIQGVAFRELDSQTFYDPFLQLTAPGILSYYALLGKNINDFIHPKSGASGNSGELQVIPALEFFLDLLLGKGIPAANIPGNTTNQNGQNIVATAGATTSKSQPFAYCVPAVIGRILGQSIAPDASVISYGSILDSVMGIQTYQDMPNIINDNQAGRAFNSQIKGDGTNRFQTLIELSGTIQPEVPIWSNVPVWSILMSYINVGINEMYATLRPDISGFIVPTLVVRQYPFTSQLYIDNQDSPLPTTPYLSLPRWVVDPTLVLGHDLGTSDSTRYNFILIYPDLVTTPIWGSDSRARITNPPIFDQLDVGRNGLRMYPHQKVRASQSALNTTLPRTWMSIVADFAASMHMTISGSITMFGVQSPIAVGDNLEYEGNVYHIEGLNHSWSCDPGGNREFVTSISVTMGVQSAPSFNTNTAFPDQNLFVGASNNALTTDNPGLTIVDNTPATAADQLPTSNTNNSTSNSGVPSTNANNSNGGNIV